MEISKLFLGPWRFPKSRFPLSGQVEPLYPQGWEQKVGSAPPVPKSTLIREKMGIGTLGAAGRREFTVASEKESRDANPGAKAPLETCPESHTRPGRSLITQFPQENGAKGKEKRPNRLWESGAGAWREPPREA